MEMRFWYCTDNFRGMWGEHGIYFSKKFCFFFSDKIQELLLREAGLKPSYKVGLSVFKPQNDLPMYEIGPISKINTAISILPEFYGDISFCWRSKSGTIVHTSDEEFEEGDLECWIEGLQPKLYWDEVNKVRNDHPLKIKNLPYELVVKGLGVHMGLTIELTDSGNGNAIISQLGEEVEKHNQKSETKSRKDGVVHNCYGHIEDNTIIFRIDVGSAGVIIIKKLLRLLAKYPEVIKVTLDL
jgi:hypothetical protein